MKSLIFRLVDYGTCHLTLNPQTPMSDQDRISPKKTNMISSRQEMRIKKKSIRGLSVDPIPNSPK